VLLTGYDDQDSKRRGMEAGADEFLQKPVSPFELDLRLRSLLRIKALTDELVRQNQRLLGLAHTDPLTGVPNRRHVLEQLRREVRRAGRYGNALAVALLDLDHFKQVNDRFGHTTGDEVLRAAARALASGIREEDTLGRIGGEEFLVVAPQVGIAEAAHMADRLRMLVQARPALAAGKPIGMTVSVGVAAVHRGAAPVSPHALFEAADRALYAAKGAGRDRVASIQLNLTRSGGSRYPEMG
jgi:diguanylate cyclase (GGDEF)-like protein